jgi:hypothetical protein
MLDRRFGTLDPRRGIDSEKRVASDAAKFSRGACTARDCVARPVHYPSIVILGFHCIISTYGFWLPNEPRGSWSEFVASWELLRFGPATKVSTHRSIAHRPYDRSLKRNTARHQT